MPVDGQLAARDIVLEVDDNAVTQTYLRKEQIG
jgi:hypothetical protein